MKHQLTEKEYNELHRLVYGKEGQTVTLKRAAVKKLLKDHAALQALLQGQPGGIGT